ncbi:MAG: PAS domain-containing protein [Bacteroidales bacterium]|jgi:transcriptional regulator with PAS, ATPase and Fis domain|nr:PAS domain-containing protein [Bacteroidales bacterium]
MDKYFKELGLAITVSDKDGNILDMNDKSISTFEKYGGQNLIGTNLNDCHPPHAQEIIARLYASHETNAYTIEKAGQKKLIYQTPWYENSEFKGYVELSLILPENMPHKVRS